MEDKKKKYQALRFGLCYGVYGILGSMALSFAVKESLEHVDYRIVHLLHLYRNETFFCTTTDKNAIVDKIIEAMEDNKRITEEELEVLLQLKELMLECPELDYIESYQRFRTLKVTESPKVIQMENGSMIAADYSYWDNECTLYPNAGGSVKDLTHEGGHLLLGRLSDYPYLSEGIVELIIAEYCRKGLPKGYWANVYYARILCELIPPNVLIQACQKDDSTLILDALTAVSENEKMAKVLLDTIEAYCKKDFSEFPTENDKMQCQQVVLSFASEVKNMKWISKERIQEYLDQIVFLHLDDDTKITFYYNQKMMNFDLTVSKKYIKM